LDKNTKEIINISLLPQTYGVIVGTTKKQLPKAKEAY